MITSARDGLVKLIDIRMMKVIKEFCAENYYDCWEGKNIAFGNFDETIIGASPKGIITIWDLKSSKVVKTCSGGHNKKSKLTCMNYNILSNNMYSADEEGYICYWN